MKKVIVTLLLCLCCAAMAGAQGIQLSSGYLYQRTQTLGGGSKVGFEGGRAEVAYVLPRHFAMVGEFTGSRSNMNSQLYDMTLLTFMAGPRFEMSLKKRGNAAKFSPFGQFLVGDARGSSGAFPKDGVLVATAECLALSVGGGIDAKIGSRTSFRLFQMDYMNTQLPNLYGTHQNYFRIGAGIVFRLR